MGGCCDAPSEKALCENCGSVLAVKACNVNCPNCGHKHECGQD